MNLAFVQSTRRACLAIAVAALAGCSSLPSSGPTAQEIVHAQRDATGAAAFSLTEIDAATIARLGVRADGQAALAKLAGAGDVDRLGPGDVLQISIYEIGTSLFSTRPSFSNAVEAPTSSGSNLPAVIVDQNGYITLPYVGQINALGRTPAELAWLIQEGLKGKSQDAQVLVNVRDNVANTVLVMGEVKKPGRISLSLAHERLLDAIALAGGPTGGATESINDSLVRVTRGTTSATAFLSDLSAGSSADVALRPQDRIEVLNRPRTFTVFGATGRVSEIAFNNPRVTLAQAVARAGGPLDQQADPTAVFVFRYDIVAPDGAPVAGAKAIAYRLNMMRPESYFLAQAFEMRGGDVIYIANARTVQPTKLVQILSQFFQPIYTAKVLAQ